MPPGSNGEQVQGTALPATAISFVKLHELLIEPQYINISIFRPAFLTQDNFVNNFSMSTPAREKKKQDYSTVVVLTMVDAITVRFNQLLGQLSSIVSSPRPTIAARENTRLNADMCGGGKAGAGGRGGKNNPKNLRSPLTRPTSMQDINVLPAPQIDPIVHFNLNRQVQTTELNHSNKAMTSIVHYVSSPHEPIFSLPSSKSPM